MVVIAVLLMALAVAVGVTVVVQNTESMTFEVIGLSVQATGAGIFLTGVAVMLALAFGIWLLGVALARSRARRAEVKALKKGRAQEVDQLQAERARLAEEKATLEEKLARREQAGATRQDVDLTARQPRDSVRPRPADRER